MLQMSSLKLSRMTVQASNVDTLVMQLSKIIISTPAVSCNYDILSSLYTNRGVLYYQIVSGPSSGPDKANNINADVNQNSNNQNAKSDFQKALEYNHLNYAAYFNLFSINFVQNSYQQGLKNLCCALSCLYLIRGKNNNNSSDINKCVKYAQNNCDGRLIKALHYHKMQKYSLAINQIQWVLEMQPNNLQIIQIKHYIQSLMFNKSTRYQSNHQNQQEKIIQNIKQNHNSDQQSSLANKERKRLICTLYDDQQQQFDYFHEGIKKLVQFNELFKQLNLNTCTRHRGQKFNIFLIRDHGQVLQGSEKIISDSRVNQINNSQNTEQQQVVTSSFNKKQQQQNVNQVGSNQVMSSYQFQGEIHRYSGFNHASSIDSVLMMSQSKPNCLQLQRKNEMVNKSPNGHDFNLLGSQMSMKKSYEQSNISNNSSFMTVNAKDENKKISIKIQYIRLYSQQMDKNTIYNKDDLYCTFQYGENKVILIKSTQIQDQIQQNLLYQPKQRQTQNKNLHIKIYKREILAFKDKYIGEGHIQISQPTQKYKIQIFNQDNKKNSNSVLMHKIGQVQICVKF